MIGVAGYWITGLPIGQNVVLAGLNFSDVISVSWVMGRVVDGFDWPTGVNSPD